MKFGALKGNPFSSIKSLSCETKFVVAPTESQLHLHGV